MITAELTDDSLLTTNMQQATEHSAVSERCLTMMYIFSRMLINKPFSLLLPALRGLLMGGGRAPHSLTFINALWWNVSNLVTKSVCLHYHIYSEAAKKCVAELTCSSEFSAGQTLMGSTSTEGRRWCNEDAKKLPCREAEATTTHPTSVTQSVSIRFKSTDHFFKYSTRNRDAPGLINLFHSRSQI